MNRRVWQRLWAASGALTVALFASGLLFGDLLGTTNFPALDASTSTVRRYFLENASEVRALSFFHVLSAIALVAFAANIYAYLRRASRAPSGVAALALAGGVVAAVFLLLSALCYRTLAEPAVAGDAPLAHALVVLSYLTGGPAIAVGLLPMIAVVAAATLRERILARWTGWLGVLTALFGAASASTLLGAANNHSATYGILLLGAVLAFAWLIVTSIALILRAPGKQPHPAEHGPKQLKLAASHMKGGDRGKRSTRPIRTYRQGILYRGPLSGASGRSEEFLDPFAADERENPGSPERSVLHRQAVRKSPVGASSLLGRNELSSEPRPGIDCRLATFAEEGRPWRSAALRRHAPTDRRRDRHVLSLQDRVSGDRSPHDRIRGDVGARRTIALARGCRIIPSGCTKMTTAFWCDLTGARETTEAECLKPK